MRDPPGTLGTMQRDPHAPGPGLNNESRRKARADKLAALLRENLLRRKAQARGRKNTAAADTSPSPASADLEAEGVVPDTDRTDAVTGGET